MIHLRPLLAALAVACVAGCSSYRLGSTLDNDIRTVHIPTFGNKTTEAFLETETTRATRQEIQKDGSLLLVDDINTADSILEVVILSYDLTPLSYDRENRTRANEYRINMEASVVLRKTADRSILVNLPSIRGDTTFSFAGDLVTARRQALPTVAADLARDIVAGITESWQ
jgi:outer membrane lipopolysaccharide assembly protein LptE/RlpB